MRAMGKFLGRNQITNLFEQNAVPPKCCPAEERSKRDQILDRSLETGPSGAAFLGLLRFPHQMPDQVIRQQVTPEFFTNHLRTLAPQDIHLHRNFDVSEIQLNLPRKMHTKLQFLSMLQALQGR